jgi:hypothetical protein
MLTLLSKRKRSAYGRFIANTARRALLGSVLRREEVWMTVVKRERWTEPEILAFPAGEHDYFDRKAAAFLEHREAIGKAVSAFANSGGGHILDRRP